MLHPSTFLLALLDRGADPILQGTRGDTPLMIKSVLGQVNMVAHLLQDPRVQSSIDTQNVDGNTALHVACCGNDEASATFIVHLLLQAGANPSITKNDGGTPLAWIQRHRPSYHTTIALLEQAPERASHLVKARRLVAISRNADAPPYLQSRVLQNLHLPRVMLVSVAGGMTDEIEDSRKLYTMLAFLLGMGGGPGDDGMPRDLFRVVLGFLMPSWDPLRRHTGAGQPMQT